MLLYLKESWVAVVGRQCVCLPCWFSLLSHAIQHCDKIIFKKLYFHLSTKAQQNGILKNLHSGERFWKDAFSVTIFTGFVWMESQSMRRKKICFQRRVNMWGWGLRDGIFVYIFICETTDFLGGMEKIKWLLQWCYVCFLILESTLTASHKKRKLQSVHKICLAT